MYTRLGFSTNCLEATFFILLENRTDLRGLPPAFSNAEVQLLSSFDRQELPPCEHFLTEVAPRALLTAGVAPR